jgi:uroporphyrinogen III methyltransferase/synthase
VDAALFNRVSWAVFASAHAVLYTHPWLEQHFFVWPSGMRFAAVGPSTASCVQKTWLCDHVHVPLQHDAEGLLKLLLHKAVPDEGVVFLPSALQGRDVLENGLHKEGFQTLRVPLYRTCTDGFEPCVLDAPVDWLVFASPSAVQGYVNRVVSGEIKRVASIGPATTQALKTHGIRVDHQAMHATLESLLEGMVAACP